MKVLWFNVNIPSGYQEQGRVVNGWQDSLENIIKLNTDVELVIAFESDDCNAEVKCVDRVKYIPMVLKYSLWERVKSEWTWNVNALKLEDAMQKIVASEKPDLIHVFGVEWPFGRIAKFTDVPVVVHIMGSIVPYLKAYYPPGYSYKDAQKIIPWWNLKRKLRRFRKECKLQSWEKCERVVWNRVQYYMGRTQWDADLSNEMHPGRIYFHVGEALRPAILQAGKEWLNEDHGGKLRLVTTGCSSFWKGPDMLVRVAQVLRSRNVDFEWLVAGRMYSEVQELVEKKEKTTFAENNVAILGFVEPERLAELLATSTIYVHTAYIENSPNSICEAQCLGVPVVSTNVGGISTLVANGEDGILVPPNEPEQMADAIMALAQNRALMETYSKNARAKALTRHDSKNIETQLLDCYQGVLRNTASH